MAVLRSKDGNSLIVDCSCGCGNGIRLKIDNECDDLYFIVAFANGNWYREADGVFGIIRRKLKRIAAVLRNKDYCYSEIGMTSKDFAEFKEYINSIV